MRQPPFSKQSPKVRKDFLHKRSRKLVNESQVICVENLAVKNLVQNHNLAKVILLRSKGSDLACLTEQIEFRSVIDRPYPLSDIAAAHECSETERTIRKIVITI